MLLFVDLETRSRVDISLGGRRYAEADTTELLVSCAVLVSDERVTGHVWSGWSGPVHGSPVTRSRAGCPPVPEHALQPRPRGLEGVSWTATWETHDPPAEVVGAVRAGALLVAHNAHGFDRHIWEGSSWPEAAWIDSVDLVRRAGYPGALEKVSQVVYGAGKDASGATLLKKYMKPCRPTKASPEGVFRDPVPATLGALATYCARDVLLLACLWYDLGLGYGHVDDPMLELHERIDEAGIPIDVDYARRLQAAEERVREAAYEEALHHVTADVLSSPQKLRRWLKDRGIDVESCRAEVLEKVSTEDPAVAAVLHARLTGANIIRGKLESLLARICPDHRYRGALAYYGAHTGRWAGRGPQFQNFLKAGKE